MTIIWKHLETHLATIGNDFGPKKANIFSCKKCDYNTSHRSHYIRHLSTDKHKNADMSMDVYDLGRKGSKRVEKGYTDISAKNDDKIMKRPYIAPYIKPLIYSPLYKAL